MRLAPSEVARWVPPPARRTARRALVRYRHLGLRPTDALLVSYPKSGSTWLRFLLAHALTGQDADFDSIRDTIPPIGRHRRGPALLPGGGRIVRSHEPLRPYLGRAGQPLIYLVRDGRDVALSYLEHERRYLRTDGDDGAFVDRFLAGEIDPYGPWHDHVLTALAVGRSGVGPFLQVRYEDLRRDPPSQLSRVLTFLNVDRDPGVLDDVVAANTKARMRAKEANSAFLGSMATDGTPFVRPDRKPRWADVVPEPIRDRCERAWRPALEACGYGVA
ncbi:MAG: sulfotransferase domain-containing protein [Acidimicrobiales bacterium]